MVFFPSPFGSLSSLFRSRKTQERNRIRLLSLSSLELINGHEDVPLRFGSSLSLSFAAKARRRFGETRAHKTRLSFSRFVSVVSSLCRRRLCLLDCKTDWMRFGCGGRCCVSFFLFFFCVGSIFFGLFVDTNGKDLALGELERLWKRKKERDILKKKGRNFLSLLSREKHLLHVRPIKRSRFFVFFSEDLRDDFDDIL